MGGFLENGGVFIGFGLTAVSLVQIRMSESVKTGAVAKSHPLDEIDRGVEIVHSRQVMQCYFWELWGRFGESIVCLCPGIDFQIWMSESIGLRPHAKACPFGKTNARRQGIAACLVG